MQDGSILPTDKYKMSCTRVSTPAQITSGPYERYYSSDISNDYIKVNGSFNSLYSFTGTQINADLDNEWDIDWYKVDIASAGTWKKYMLVI